MEKIARSSTLYLLVTLFGGLAGLATYSVMGDVWSFQPTSFMACGTFFALVVFQTAMSFFRPAVVGPIWQAILHGLGVLTINNMVLGDEPNSLMGALGCIGAFVVVVFGAKHRTGDPLWLLMLAATPGFGAVMDFILTIGRRASRPTLR